MTAGVLGDPSLPDDGGAGQGHPPDRERLTEPGRRGAGWGRRGPRQAPVGEGLCAAAAPPRRAWDPLQGRTTRGAGSHRPGAPRRPAWTRGREQHSRDCAAVCGVCVCMRAGWAGPRRPPAPLGTAVRGPRQPQTVPGTWLKRLRLLRRRDASRPGPGGLPGGPVPAAQPRCPCRSPEHRSLRHLFLPEGQPEVVFPAVGRGPLSRRVSQLLTPGWGLITFWNILKHS